LIIIGLLIGIGIIGLFFIFVNTINNILPNPWEVEDLVGRKAPHFVLKDLQNKEVNFMDFRGKVLIINFWSTGCPACREEIPSLIKLKNIYEGKNFEIVAISVDRSLQTLKEFVKNEEINFIVLYDEAGMVSRKYKVFLLPTTFLVNKKGIIIEKFFGKYDWTSKEITSKIEENF